MVLPCVHPGGGGESNAAEAAEPERPLALDGCHVVKEDETPHKCLMKLNKTQFPTLKAKSHMRKATLPRVPIPGDLDMFIPASTLDERAEGREGGGEEAQEAASEPLKISGIEGKKAGCARVEARGRGVQAGDMLQVGPEAYSKS